MQRLAWRSCSLIRRRSSREIGDWSTCDSFCNTLKFVRKDPERVWAFLRPYFSSEREFDVRFGVVMLLDHFIQEAFIDRVLETLDNVRHTGYYAQMAVAWALAECYARFPERTMAYLPNSRLDTFPFNKALQKMTESRRICGEGKGTAARHEAPVTAFRLLGQGEGNKARRPQLETITKPEQRIVKKGKPLYQQRLPPFLNVVHQSSNRAVP